MTIPNVLTIGRILLTPLLIWLLLNGRVRSALLVFFIAGMTDGLDGLIARVFNQKSRLGAFLDPIADKLLLVSTFIMLAYLSLVPSWLVVITVGRDVIIILGIVGLLLFKVPLQIKPSAVSKATTLVQLLTLLAVLGSTYVKLPVLGYSALFFITAVLSLISGIHYISVGLALFDAHRKSVK